MIKSMNIDAVTSILATILYVIERKKISSRRAFSYVCRCFGCGRSGMDREELYRLVIDFITNYHRLLYIARSIRGSEPSHKALARLYLYLKLRELGEKVPTKLRKAINRDISRIGMEYDIEEPWALYSVPKWIYDKLVTVLPMKDVEELLKAINRRVLWIRINTLKIDIDRALRTLENSCVAFVQDNRYPFMLRITRVKKPIRRLELFKNGSIVMQDKASIYTVLALRPEPGMTIYDFAAAPGIKTSLIMQLTENRARIIAIDISRRRLEAMKLLLQKYGVDTSRVDLVLSDSRYISMAKRADASLIDAVCSSSGAMPRDPSIRIILRNQSILEEMKRIQIAMLENALRYTDVAVYAVCSLFPEEGEEVVETLMERGMEHKVVDAKIPVSRGYKGYRIWSLVSRTFPHIDESEGFFIARLER